MYNLTDEQKNRVTTQKVMVSSAANVVQARVCEDSRDAYDLANSLRELRLAVQRAERELNAIIGEVEKA